MEKPYLSIITCVYNGEQFVSRSIESVLNQPFKNLELLIIDDGSTDSTLKVLEKYQHDKRVRIFHQENKGPGPARNALLNKTVGKWMMFLDADDYYLPNSINDDFIKFLEECKKSGVDTIRTPKIQDFGQNTKLVENLLDYEGIFENTIDESMKIKFEFFTIIYNRKVIIENNIKFKDTLPEFESIFRHEAVLYSRKVMLSNKLRYVVKTDTKTSITHNWNTLDNCKLRLKYFAELNNKYKIMKIKKLVLWTKSEINNCAFYLKHNGLSKKEINSISIFYKYDFLSIFFQKIKNKF